MNKSLPRDIHIKFLADVSQHIPILAQWTYDAWKQYDPTLRLENIIESLKKNLNTDKIPLTYVAIHNGKPVGMVSLKPKIKLADYTDRPLWLGSYFVIEAYRGRGIGTQLLDSAFNKARELGYPKISLFTSNPLAALGYEKKGWKKFATDSYQEHAVVLMEYII